MEKVPEPDRFTLHVETHSTQPVIPVPRPDERKAARAALLPHTVDRPCDNGSSMSPGFAHQEMAAAPEAAQSSPVSAR